MAIRFRRQAGDADSGVAFVADVEADEQGGDLLEGAGVFQFAAVERAHSGDFGGERARELSGGGIVAADDDVAVDGVVSVQEYKGIML